jgi:hypothetical protein
MALFKGKLLAGALFAGAIFSTNTVDQEHDVGGSSSKKHIKEKHQYEININIAESDDEEEFVVALLSELYLTGVI